MTSVSVIIPTFNRKNSLLRTLESISFQDYKADHFEVIVVDDGGTDSTESIIKWHFPFSLFYHRQVNLGEVAARNLGASKSSGELLIFLDDDIEVNQVYLSSIVETHRAHPGSVVIASISEVINDDKSGNFKPGLDQRLQMVSQSTKEKEAERVTFIECMSGIISISRKNFYEIGQMQPLLPNGRNPWGGIDFGFRAYTFGMKFWRANGAIAYHHDATLASFEKQCQRLFRVSREVQHLFKKYPEIEGQIPMFQDKSPIAWRKDRPMLIIRKLARKLISSPYVLRSMEKSLRLIEGNNRSLVFQGRLSRWIASAYIYQGYQEGLDGV